ncbi:MAG: helicase-associated domain-containing protein [Candidatus Sumerlaeia bacterium]|nr:helicase-associated domain-containing protein [Candidatus Sumerlaeia bacterium]
MSGFNPANPVIVQSDLSVLLETDNALYEEARDALARFAELEKSPDYIHTYRITPLSLWNAAAAGESADEICSLLLRYAKYPVPEAVLIEVREQASRYGRLKLVREGEDLVLQSTDRAAMLQVTRHKKVQPYLVRQLDPNRWVVDSKHRGLLKQALIKIKFPVEDLAGYLEGDPLPMELREETVGGRGFGLREYQRDAADIFYAAGSARGGSGVLVLPCGAGKTIIGIATMARIGQRTLILTTNITSLRQWRAEILDKTTLRPDEVGEYSGEMKEIKPVTISTYQLMTFRKKKTDEFAHMELFNSENWGLIVYDEVHMLPAPVFRTVADIQARRRLGLTATLVREDGLADDVFSLIGPKKFDVPWRQLESQGWIATAECVEMRVPLPSAMKVDYAVADAREQFRIASESPAKVPVLLSLLERHRGDSVLIIGQYLDQLEIVSREVGVPIITGKTPNKEREELYRKFKAKEINTLVVSKVANFAVDLPDANVAVQVAGTFGSRQEEAQRLGRVLRPKGAGRANIAHFYSIVTRDSVEQEFAAKRQRFLAEQGYSYRIEILESEDMQEAGEPTGR